MYVTAIKLEKGIAGIWMGPASVMILSTFAYVLMWSTIDWEKLIDRA